MKALGAGVAVWAMALFGAAVVNTLYPAFLMTRKRTWNLLLENLREILLALVYKLLFFILSMLLGKRMILLGALGASVGFCVVQGTLILDGQALGFVSGEWRGITAKPRTYIYLAIWTLIFAMVILAAANSLIAGASVILRFFLLRRPHFNCMHFLI